MFVSCDRKEREGNLWRKNERERDMEKELKRERDMEKELKRESAQGGNERGRDWKRER